MSVQIGCSDGVVLAGKRYDRILHLGMSSGAHGENYILLRR